MTTTGAPVLVTTDELIMHLAVDNAFILIHYSMPAEQHKFNYRMSSVQSILPKKFEPLKVS